MAATPLPSDDLGGRVLGGRYRIRSLRGRGGMGAVWVAHDDVDAKDVAIKVVRAALLEDPQAMGRFKREAKVIRGLDHPGIVRSLDAGEDAGMLWIAMELLEGETLRERLDARGRMTWEESLAAAKSILDALGAAHAAGVIHRDLKPDNVMMLADGRIKLLDFGVAKQSHLESASVVSSMTGTGFIVGTPGYVAPEVVLEGKNDDPRSDLYAFGVLWFEMLTGQKPFTAKTPFALAMRHAHEPAPRASTLLPFSPIPLAVENLIAQLMAKSPDERPPSAGAVVDLVDAIERGAAQAMTGTPTPGSIDKTETDIKDTPDGTAVVPMKLTPVQTSAPVTTPATGMVSTPLAASPLPGLLKALPKKHRAALAVAFVFALFGAFSALMLALRVADEPIPLEVVVDDNPRYKRLDAMEGMAQQAANAPPAAPVVEPPRAEPVAPIVPVAADEANGTSERGTSAGSKASGNRSTRKSAGSSKSKDAKNEHKTAGGDAARSKSPLPDDAFIRVGVGDPYPSISIDGDSPRQSPRELVVPAGRHVISFSGSPLKLPPVTIDVEAGACRAFIIAVKDGNTALVRSPNIEPCPR